MISPSPISHLPSPKSRTAILITGHMRTFDRCLPTQIHHVYRHYPDADFFVSTVQDAAAHKAQLLGDKYGAHRVHIDIVAEQPISPRPAGCPPEESWQSGQCFMHEPYAISVPPQAILRQLWQLHRAWGHFSGQLSALSRQLSDYDTVIRLRPDSYFHSFQKPEVPFCGYTPWWGRFGGVNDRFAILSLKMAEAYFTAYRHIDRYIAEGCPLHPESIIKLAIDESGLCNAKDLRAEFSTLKQVNGELQQRPPEISSIDLAHCPSCIFPEFLISK